MSSGFSIEDNKIVLDAQKYADKRGNNDGAVNSAAEIKIFQDEISNAYVSGDLSINGYSLAMDLSLKMPIKEEKKEEKVTPPAPRPVNKTTTRVVPETKAEETRSGANFESSTVELNKRTFIHKTNLLNLISRDLGIYEISYSEYLNLKKNNPEELNNTQYKIIGNNGNITDQWCAHTVSYYSKLAGVDIGAHKSTVQAFINWAGKDYKPIMMSTMTRNNYTEERKSRATQIGEQIKRMHEGDFIIWKANASNHGSYIINIEGGELKSYQSSHIGIIEHVDIGKGVVTVIEGNANVPKLNENNERMLVTSGRDGRNGAQRTGEYQEVNKRDGLLRKQYTIEELAAYGYTGYIDNSSRVK